MDATTEVISLKSRWEKLNGEKNSVVDRAKACAELTIPSLLVDTSHTENTTLNTPYQSLGARAVNNLASKLLLSLLPPNAPFFRFVPDKIAMLELEAAQPGAMASVNNQLADIERAIAAQIEREALRVPTFEALKLLVATGNALVYRDKTEGTRVYNLNSYCVKRTPEGKVKEILTKETVTYAELPQGSNVSGEALDKEVELYTIVKWNGKTFDAWQEAGGNEVEGTRGVFQKDKLPYMPLRWTSVHNEDYGRGLVEQYLGDLRSLEALTMSIIEASAASSKMLFLVNPVGATNIRALAKAPSGSFIRGNANDITTMQVAKGNDLRIAYEVAGDIQRRLAAAFLLNESASRQAERVTAEEVRLMAGELEDALGGIYSILTQELQLPLIRLLMASSKVNLPKDLVEPIIVTGVEALGRGHDFNKLVQFAQTLQGLLGPEIFAQYTNVDAVISQIGTSLGIETKGLVKSQEQLQQEAQAQQEQQQAAMMQQAGQTGLDAAAQNAGAMAGQQLAAQ